MALVALAAEGTVPSADILMLAPVIDSASILPPETAPLAILPPVTDLAFSWREPTLLGGTLKAA